MERGGRGKMVEIGGPLMEMYKLCESVCLGDSELGAACHRCGATRHRPLQQRHQVGVSRTNCSW